MYGYTKKQMRMIMFINITLDNQSMIMLMNQSLIMLINQSVIMLMNHPWLC